MKLKIFFIVSLCITINILVSCQPTPDTSYIVGKNDGTLEEAINATPRATQADNSNEEQSSDALAVPDRVSKEYEDDTVKIAINATVVVHPARAYPVIRVEDEKLSQELAACFLDALIGNEELYNAKVPYTKDQLYAQMLETIYHYQKGDWDYDASIQSEEDIRKMYAEQMESAPETVELLLIDRENLSDGFEARTNVGEGFDKWISMLNDEELGLTVRFYNNGDTLYRSYPKTENSIHITQHDAQQIANAFINRCFGNDVMKLFSYEKVQDNVSSNDDQFLAHKFIYTRSIAGTPITYDDMGGQTTFSEAYSKIWNVEHVEVQINDQGISALKWDGAIKFVDVVNGSVLLKPFEEILENAVLQLKLTNPYQDIHTIYGINIFISQIRLGYMRVHEKDSMYTSLLIPVWDFIGTTTPGGKPMDDNAEEYVLLTVNAIDGSIIDRTLGY
ncbi:MAG: DUF6034 family protein [Oscillospiraceae bacterium]